MARSAADATRFTATGPYASSKPAPRASTISLSSPAPAGETPQQKVARLKDAARRAKLDQVSGFDKVVARGRVWADRVHRVTALSLITLTGVGTIVAVFALGDMVVYNRRKKKEWLNDQREMHAKKLVLAYQAATAGTATEDQMLLINQERAHREAENARRNKPGIFKRAKGYVYSGLSMEEPKGGKLGAASGGASAGLGANAAEERAAPALNVASQGSGQGRGVLEAVEDARRQGGKARPRIRGGMLDQLGDNIATAASQNSKSWTSWISGRS